MCADIDYRRAGADLLRPAHRDEPTRGQRAALRTQISELEGQKAKLADPVFIAAQARERLGFVKPGDIPYQVQLPPGTVLEQETGPQNKASGPSADPWYTALWHTIADTPHGPPAPAKSEPPGLPAPAQPSGPPPPLPPPPPPPGG